MNFANQIVLITGASQGIGRCLAIDFAKLGAVVIGCGRSQKRLDQTLQEVRPISPASTMMPCDVGRAEQVESMVAKILADFDRIDILINNAGVGMRRPFVETPLETIEEIMRTNYLGMVYCTHAVIPSMIARRSGHIVNISSVAGHIGSLNLAGYCASKFAMNGFSESLYHELKPFGVFVSLICPGPVRTEFDRTFTAVSPKSPPALMIEPEVVASEVVRAVETKTFEIIITRSMAFLCWFKRMTPGLFRYLAHRVLRKGLDSSKGDGT